MVIRSRIHPCVRARSMNSAALVEVSLRNHLCFLALRKEYAAAFRLGTIVRTMFDAFYLFDARFDKGDIERHS